MDEGNVFSFADIFGEATLRPMAATGLQPEIKVYTRTTSFHGMVVYFNASSLK